MPAKRYNKGKVRHELVPANAIHEVAKVYTLGAHKYSVYRDKDGKLINGSELTIDEAKSMEMVEDASANWRLGQNWQGMMASVKRHISDWERGQDMDPEFRTTYHLAHAAWGLLSLIEYYKIYPQGDDRPHWYLNRPRIALDIDEVIADWVGHWTKYHGQITPEFWNFDAEIGLKFEALKDDKPFWMSIPPKIDPSELPFEPCCYVTSRVIPTSWTEEWIAKSGFPTMPVITVGPGQSKVEALRNEKVDIFVDDRFENFVEINAAGICCYLMDAPHNRRYDVGHKRITDLKQLVMR